VSAAPAPAEGMVTLTEAAEQLGVHYMTAYRYVRTGRLPAVKHGSEWRVRADDVATLVATGAADSGPTPAGGGKSTPHGRGHRRTNWAQRAEDRLVAGDEAGAWAVLEGAMSSGMSPEDLYLDVLVPALHAVGHRWSTGELTVADEHRASGLSLRVIGRLGPRFARRGRRRGTIILATPPGETHGLPVALMGDLLRGRGFDVADLGADVPSDSLASTARTTSRLVAVGLCATVSSNEPNLGRSIEAVRAVTDVPVIVGGGAMLGRQTSVLALGADGGGLSTSEVLEVFEHLSSVNA